MAFNDPRRRRAGRSRPNNAPVRQQNNAGGANNNFRQNKKIWQTNCSFYSDESCLECMTIASWYRQTIGLKFTPALENTSNDGRRQYNHDASIFIVVNFSEAVTMIEQLEALRNGKIKHFELSRDNRGDYKIIHFGVGSDFDYSNPNSLAVGIESYKEGSNQPDDMVSFEFAPIELDLGGKSKEIFHPDYEALIAYLNSFINNIARVDFASIRLIESPMGGGRQERAETRPQRRFGGRSGGEIAAEIVDDSDDYISESDEITAALGGDTLPDNVTAAGDPPANQEEEELKELAGL